MARKPQFTISRDANGVAISAQCSCGREMPQPSPKGVLPDGNDKWFKDNFDVHVAEEHSGARLIDDGDLKRCSICKRPFPPDSQPTVDRAFKDHLLTSHRPGQRSEDVNQAAARIVRDTTD